MAPIWNATFPATPNLAAQAFLDVLSTFMELAIGLAIVGGIAAMTILLCGTSPMTVGTDRARGAVRSALNGRSVRR